MTKTINNRKNMTTQELEAVSGGVVPWAAISVGIAAAKLTYDLSYAAGKSFYNPHPLTNRTQLTSQRF